MSNKSPGSMLEQCIMLCCGIVVLNKAALEPRQRNQSLINVNTFEVIT